MKQVYDSPFGTTWQPVDLEEPPFNIFLDTSDAIIQEKLDWIRSFESTGLFYFDGIFNKAYFEYDEDRTMFLLRWGAPK